MKTIEVIYHVRLIHEHDADRKFWGLRIAAAAQAGDSKFVNDVTEDVRVIADFGKRRRHALEMVDGEERVAMIGTILKRSRSEWFETGNADHWIGWLGSQGLTEADAVAASDAKLREILADPFWEE